MCFMTPIHRLRHLLDSTCTRVSGSMRSSGFSRASSSHQKQMRLLYRWRVAAKALKIRCWMRYGRLGMNYFRCSSLCRGSLEGGSSRFVSLLTVQHSLHLIAQTGKSFNRPLTKEEWTRSQKHARGSQRQTFASRGRRPLHVQNATPFIPVFLGNCMYRHQIHSQSFHGNSRVDNHQVSDPLPPHRASQLCRDLPRYPLPDLETIYIEWDPGCDWFQGLRGATIGKLKTVVFHHFQAHRLAETTGGAESPSQSEPTPGFSQTNYALTHLQLGETPISERETLAAGLNLLQIFLRVAIQTRQSAVAVRKRSSSSNGLVATSTMQVGRIYPFNDP